MKKIIFALLVLALPMIVLASFQPATLTNGVNKVVVTSQEMANRYFGMNYVLDTRVGATPGTVHSNLEYFDAGMVYGSRKYASSSTLTTATLKAGDIMNYDVIDFTPNNGSGITLSLPASSTLTNFIPKVGNSIEKYIRNATTTASIDITMAGGTGTIIKKVAGGALTVVGDTDSSNFGKLVFKRKANKDIVVLYESFID